MIALEKKAGPAPAFLVSGRLLEGSYGVSPGSTRKAAKLADVARLARVSTATVSRALTLPGKVKPATVTRIRRAVEALG